MVVMVATADGYIHPVDLVAEAEAMVVMVAMAEMVAQAVAEAMAVMVATVAMQPIGNITVAVVAAVLMATAEKAGLLLVQMRLLHWLPQETVHLVAEAVAPDAVTAKPVLVVPVSVSSNTLSIKHNSRRSYYENIPNT